MKAYVIAAETIKDQAMFDEYKKAVVATVTAYGGKFVARGGTLTVFEGERPSFAIGDHRVPFAR